MLKLFRDTRLHRNYIAEEEELMYVPQEILRSVAFLYMRYQGENVPMGTAFFVLLQDTRLGLYWKYVVTARHVIEKIKKLGEDKKAHLRLNLKETGHDWHHSNLGDWIVNRKDQLIDVAVLPWASKAEDFEIGEITDEFFMNNGHVDQLSIGPGDETATVGLFSEHHGEERNIPVVRIGNIAAMPSSISTDLGYTKGNIDAYLIESRSTRGLSGSPVFWSMGHSRYVGSKLVRATHGADAGGVFVLMGLVHGHYDEPKNKTSHVFGPINTGIALVIPMEKIKEVLDQKELAMKRSKDVENYKKKHSPTLDSSLLARSVIEAAIGEPLTGKTKKLGKKAKKRAK